jgi:mannose-6-phosphate isomerase class I
MMHVPQVQNKEMRLLVKNQKENEPKEPVMPDKEEVKSPCMIKKYETELKQDYFKKERYEEHKAKIFVIVKGQCTLNMKNKVESLLQGSVNDLTFETHEEQYGYWSICQTVRRVLTMR